ncbi:MAG TPA: C13 family peptidase [Caulobacteraceae bacterium]|nr:C13 family peptidase [Caulobacteraceae bacterium]
MSSPGATIVGAITALCLAALPMAAAAAASPFAGWAAVVVAGDFHAHSGAPSEAFDNARHDVAQALVKAGFDPSHVQQFSVRPQNYPGENLQPSDPALIDNALIALAQQAKDGCLLYFSSHGAPTGIVVGQTPDGQAVLLSPDALSKMVDRACGSRPTVVILSACFSGVFVKPVSDVNRAVFTAARPDRTSFGCGESDRYPYYDDCILSSFPKVGDFQALATTTKDCVAAKEVATGMKPPSEPQISVGAGLRPMLPLYTFSK